MGFFTLGSTKKFDSDNPRDSGAGGSPSPPQEQEVPQDAKWPASGTRTGESPARPDAYPVEGSRTRRARQEAEKQAKKKAAANVEAADKIAAARKGIVYRKGLEEKKVCI